MLRPGLKYLGKKLLPRQYWQYKIDALTAAAHEDKLRLVSLLCDQSKTSVDVERQYWQYRFDALTAAAHEDELRLVSLLCDQSKTSVDVGAAAGIFSVHMLKASRNVIAFEPRPSQAEELQAMFASVGAPARVEAVALSNQVGTSKMRMLVKDLGRSTIEAENPLEDEDGSARAQIKVKVRRLDDYGLDDVGFIKIDVEGHEVAALQGARATIERNQPILLIEAEERHRKNAVADVTAFLQDLGYYGFFLLAGRLHPMAEFSIAKHQDSHNIGSWKSSWERRGIYINNFLFVPGERVNRFAEAVRNITRAFPDTA